MICPKCGTENVPGDAFCGSCGAFLEFAAEEAAEEGPAGGQAAAVAVPAAPAAAALSPAAPAAAAPSPTAGLPATRAPAAAPPADSAGGVTCGACGHANPAGRRFCISCKNRLGLPAAAGAAAPQADPGKPSWDFPMQPRPAAPPPATGAPPAPSAGGRSRLLMGGGILVAVVALVALGAALLLGGGLGGGTAGTTPSPSPLTGAASEAPSPGETAAPGTPGEEPSPEPSTEPTAPPATIPPGPAVGIKITGAKASSQLKADRAPKYLFDGSPATSWSSATGKFQGAWVEVTFAPAAITRIQIWGGWQKSDPLYLGSHRPQNVTVSFDGGDPVPLELLDVRKPQGVDIPPELGIVRATRLRITIADVYPAQKTTAKGTPTKEAAISEIRLFGIPVAP